MNPIDAMRIQDMINNAIKPLKNRIEDLEKENKKLSSELSAIRSANICCCPSMFKCRIHSVDMFRVSNERQMCLDDRVDETRRTRMIDRIIEKSEKKKTQLIDNNELAEILKQSAPIVTRNVLSFSNINVNDVDNDDLNMDIEDIKDDCSGYPDNPDEVLEDPLPSFQLYDDWLSQRNLEENIALSLPKLSKVDIRRASLDTRFEDEDIKVKTVEEEFNDFFGPNDAKEPVVEVKELVVEVKEPVVEVKEKKKKAKKSTPPVNQDPNNLEAMKIDDLKAYCRANNIKGFSKYKKKIDLINFIRSNQ